MKALSLGACDFIAKPEATAFGGVETYRRELIEKIVALGGHQSRRHDKTLDASREAGAARHARQQP